MAGVALAWTADREQFVMRTIRAMVPFEAAVQVPASVRTVTHAKSDCNASRCKSRCAAVESPARDEGAGLV
jgi:hypothetical protein